MAKYNITNLEIECGANRILADAYATATVCDTPELIYISAGPGAGKTSIETLLKRKFKERGIRTFEINSDKIATFHPSYEEALEELPEECYRITRQFVRPVTPLIFDKLKDTNIVIVNENTLDKGDEDIENAKKFKKAGYRISVNIMATDLFESRISCFERDAASLQLGLTPRGCSLETQQRMYNSFSKEVKQLDEIGILDEINVYVRGENLSKPPKLKYKKGDTIYKDFQEAIDKQRDIQREKLLKNPERYLVRIEDVRKIVEEYSTNEILKQNSLDGLNRLKRDYIREVAKYKEKSEETR